MTSTMHWTAVLAAALVLPVHAEQAAVQHDAHEHGMAALDVALDGSSLQLEFSSPAANIVGFEHSPRSADQKTAVTEAVATLERAGEVFEFPEDGSCELVSVSVETELMGEEEHHGEERHEDNEHAHVDTEDVHSDFHANYRYDCADATTLNTVKVKLFELYSGIEEIHARVIGPSGQTARDLTGAKPDLPL